MIIRVQGDALDFIQSMDWTVRVDIWIVLMNGYSLGEHDNVVAASWQTMNKFELNGMSKKMVWRDNELLEQRGVRKEGFRLLK